MSQTMLARRVLRPANIVEIRLQRKDWYALKDGRSVRIPISELRDVPHKTLIRVRPLFGPRNMWTLAFAYRHSLRGPHLSRQLK